MSNLANIKSHVQDIETILKGKTINYHSMNKAVSQLADLIRIKFDKDNLALSHLNGLITLTNRFQNNPAFKLKVEQKWKLIKEEFNKMFG